MTATIYPSNVHGQVAAPPSKSCMQRSCAAALLQSGTSIITNPGRSNDDRAALEIIQKLGATVSGNSDGSITIVSSGVRPREAVLNGGESGLAVRMFTPIAALSEQPLTITGEGSLLNRPMDFFQDVLPNLGVQVTSGDGKLPLHIQGPLQPSDIEVDGSLSSQFLTGLLMTFGATASKPVTITVKDLRSRPYIDLTLRMMKHFGLNVPVNDKYQSFTFSAGRPSQEEIRYAVEGDWSGAAFLLAAGATAGKVTITGLDIYSAQADKSIIEVLQRVGSKLLISEEKIEVATAALKSFQFDATDCPDLFPPLVSLASCCTGTSVIQGVSRLVHKESNRALTLQEEFARMGVSITLQGDTMLIEGGGPINGATIYSHHDHRIAMACAVAGLRTTGEVKIEASEAINKSYPDFYQHLQKLGARIFVE